MKRLPTSKRILYASAAAATASLQICHAQTGGNLSNCKGGCSDGRTCVGNPFSQPVTDSDCSGCAKGQYWWPCNFETLCFCADAENGPRVPPAPSTKLEANAESDPCTDILTEDVFDSIVQPQSDDAKALFSYSGLCNAISMYNRHHDEKFAAMGTEEQVRAELASFLAHAAADTYGYSVVRDERHCTDPLTGSDGKLYCSPCKEENFNKESKTCSEAWIVSDTPYEEFCDVARGNGEQGCQCKNVTMATVPGNTDATGYIAATDAYFPRGAIIASWNYDFLGVSVSLTGDSSILCDNPDLVATESQYAWGAGIVKFMEKMQFGTTGETAHKQIMKGNFGGSVEVLYSELECPSNEWTSLDHVDMVKVRVKEVCKAGAALGVYVDMNKCDDSGGTCLECEGLADLYKSCKEDGSCPECQTWTQFVKSEAPTITPKIVESPSWEDWAAENAPRPEAGACFGSPSWSVLVTVGVSFGIFLL